MEDVAEIAAMIAAKTASNDVRVRIGPPLFHGKLAPEKWAVNDIVAKQVRNLDQSLIEPIFDSLERRQTQTSLAQAFLSGGI